VEAVNIISYHICMFHTVVPSDCV